MNKPTLTPEHVQSVLKECLFKDEELVDGQAPEEHLYAEGIVHNFMFHPGRIAQHDDEIAEMLNELPTEFQDESLGGKGGWSFLNACNRRDPDHPGTPFEALDQWTGLHQTMEELMCLGIAAGRVQVQLPRPVWSALPGGVPYFVVTPPQNGDQSDEVSDAGNGS